MKKLIIVNKDRCLKMRGNIDTCYDCRLYLTICLGNTKDIATILSEKIKNDRVEKELSVA